MDIKDARLTDEEVYESPLVSRRQVADAATAKALRAVYEWLGMMDECTPGTPDEDCVCGRFRVAFGDMLEIWDVEGNMTEIELGT